MDFTEIYKQTASLVSFSPGTHFLLTAVQDRLIVRRSDSFQIARTWQLQPNPSPPSSSNSNSNLNSTNANSNAQQPQKTRATPGPEGYVTHAAWSSDSEYILGACARRSFVEVFKIRDEEWRARIDVGAEGLARVEWTPDGRSILCFSEWGVSRHIFGWRRISVDVLILVVAPGYDMVACDGHRDLYSVPHPPRPR